MTFAVSIRIAAKQDIAAAEDWYESKEPGLGLQFRAAVADAVGRIASSPLEHPEILLGNRRHVMRRFPYNIWFRVVGQDILILAVLHGRRGVRAVRTRVGG